MSLLGEPFLKKQNLCVVFVRSEVTNVGISIFPLPYQLYLEFYQHASRLLDIYSWWILSVPSTLCKNSFISDTVLFYYLLFPCLTFCWNSIFVHVLSNFCTFMFTILLFNSLAKIPAPECSWFLLLTIWSPFLMHSF